MRTHIRELKAPRMAESAFATAATSAPSLRKVRACRGIRVLAWDGDILYGCRGYELVRWDTRSKYASLARDVEWQFVARFHPAWWRNVTARTALSSRFVRDGFHALAILNKTAPSEGSSAASNQTLIAAVPGAIVTRTPGSDDFRVTHKIRRGTRPLHITTVPDGTAYWENISTIASATRFTFSPLPIAARPGRLPTHSPRARSAMYTTLFTTVGEIASGS